jgi:hypothetical protein
MPDELVELAGFGTLQVLAPDQIAPHVYFRGPGFELAHAEWC